MKYTLSDKDVCQLKMQADFTGAAIGEITDLITAVKVRHLMTKADKAFKNGEMYNTVVFSCADERLTVFCIHPDEQREIKLRDVLLSGL